MRAMLVLALTLAGCGPIGRSCTLMYAPDTVFVSFDGGGWSPGSYEIELTGGGSTAMCVVTLPATEEDPASCTDNVVELELSDAGDAVTGMTVWEFAPDAFTIEVLRDGEMIAEQELTPEYEIDEPNGRGCGERRSASVTMTIGSE